MVNLLCYMYIKFNKIRVLFVHSIIFYGILDVCQRSYILILYIF